MVCDAVFNFHGFPLLPPVLRCMCTSNMRQCNENTLKLIDLVRISEAIQNYVSKQHNWCYYVTSNFYVNLYYEATVFHSIVNMLSIY
jgi:hypothetical protein